MNQIAKVDDKSSLSISLPYLAQVVELEKEVLILKTEIEFYKKEIEKKD